MACVRERKRASFAARTVVWHPLCKEMKIQLLHCSILVSPVSGVRSRFFMCRRFSTKKVGLCVFVRVSATNIHDTTFSMLSPIACSRRHCNTGNTPEKEREERECRCAMKQRGGLRTMTRSPTTHTRGRGSFTAKENDTPLARDVIASAG